MTHTFTCDECGGTFDSDRPDEEAEAEMLEQWGSIEPDDRAIICDDCYNSLVRCLAKPE